MLLLALVGRFKGENARESEERNVPQSTVTLSLWVQARALLEAVEDGTETLR